MDDNQQFSITENEIGEKYIDLSVSGRIDAINSAVLETKLTHALDSGHVRITIDMIGVRFLSSMGIRVILKAFKEAKARGGALRISEPSEIVKNVLGMTALEEMVIK